MKAFDSTLSRTPFAGSALPSRVGGLSALIDRVLLWQQRQSERHSMRGMSDQVLKDIGVRRVDMEREASKPFWMA